MRRLPDVPVFIGLVFVYSVALTALVWVVPGLKGVFYPRNSLIVVPVVSVILSARAVLWRRKLIYAGVILGTFLLIDVVFTFSGLAAFAWESLAIGFLGTAVGVAYMVFAQAFPLVVLLVFVGRDPSILWTASPAPRAAKASRVGEEAGVLVRKRPPSGRAAAAQVQGRRRGGSDKS